ncbi:hypothetical protein [Paraflavitalea sp. CAU 1676]|uniref:hypothetical protein n=1 Tax=Paraflavitalea sp. CAU 1676 TaxID=3032598 RepID=UPI0023DC8659|nr:hypothetical protein [Paraflavitalea sp. CAU 1676]MDF2192035.1 hypothetical protein [Paraflavitalea sp. CAU 1676]
MKHYIQTILQRPFLKAVMLTVTAFLTITIGNAQSPSQPDMPDSIRCGPYLWNWRSYPINGLGKLDLTSFSYVFVKTGNKITTRKEITYIGNDCGELFEAASEWLTISNDTLFDWLSRQLPTIRHEKLLDLIVQEVYQGDTSYRAIRSSHPTTCVLAYYQKGSVTVKTIEEDAIQPLFRELGKNLNYAYNTSTPLYKFYIMLKQRIEFLDNQYVFKPVKH